MLQFKKEVGVESKDNQSDMEDHNDEEEMDDGNLDEKR